MVRTAEARLGAATSLRTWITLLRNAAMIWRHAFAYPAGVFCQRHISAVVQPIFDAPMPLGQFQESLGVGSLRREAGDPMHHLHRLFALFRSFPHQLESLLQTSPVLVLWLRFVVVRSVRSTRRPRPLSDLHGLSSHRPRRPLVFRGKKRRGVAALVRGQKGQLRSTLLDSANDG